MVSGEYSISLYCILRPGKHDCIDTVEVGFEWKVGNADSRFVRERFEVSKIRYPW